jgi:threonine/homoserine/homoserine lactone efflux protein
MPEVSTILAVMFAGFALSATPGPSMLYVLSHTVGQNRAAGLASAIGLALGGVILALATALGLAAVFAQFGWMVVALRYVGSAYLVWLGIGMIQGAQASASMTLKAHRMVPKSFAAIVWQGILVELLNPKTVLFFALFLPPFVKEGIGSVHFQLLVLGALVPLTAVPSDVCVAYMGGALAKTVNDNRAARLGMAWFGGLVLIAIAINLHLRLL